MEHTRGHFLKWAGYCFLILLFYLLETQNGIRLAIFGIRPELLPFLVATAALFEGPEGGGVIGIFTGVLMDITLGGPDGAMALLLGFAGLCAGAIAHGFFRNNFFSALALGGLLSLFVNLLRFVFYYALLYRVSFLGGMSRILLEAAVSALFFPLAYLPMRKIFRRWAEAD